MVPSRRSFIACLQLRHLPDGKKGSTEPSLETAQSTPRIGPPASLSDTLFARIIRAFPDTRHLLNIQYRFNTDINDFPSMKMYETKLMPDKSVKDRNLGELLADNDPESDLHQPVIFFDTAGLAMSESGDEGESKWNENEATIVHDYVTNLVSNRSTVVSQIPQGYIPDHEQLSLGLPAAAIAVISPYRAQVGVLHHRLVNLGVEVGSVDRQGAFRSWRSRDCKALTPLSSWQGREQEVVIISLVRSNDEVSLLATRVPQPSAHSGRQTGRSWLLEGLETLERGHDPCQAPTGHRRRFSDCQTRDKVPQGLDGLARRSCRRTSSRVVKAKNT